MLGVAFLNQQIWQGQGGNNPLLQLVLEERDPLALGLFLFTAAVAAPVFEEILFRGFLLPSLTRYMSAWWAIGLSGLIFAVAHLSFSEILPLTVLGAILGFVYVRSQNLLSLYPATQHLEQRHDDRLILARQRRLTVCLTRSFPFVLALASALPQDSAY